MNRAFLIAALLLFVACEHTGRKRGALSSAHSRDVRVESYNLDGSAETVAQRRLRAYSRIKKTCAPDTFQIFEEVRHDPAVPRETPQGTASKQNLAFVRYGCFKGKTK